MTRAVGAATLCTISTLGVLAPGAVAHAVPATAADFQIRYYTVDEDGNRGRALTLQDLQQYYNRARCECAQLIEAQITLVSTTGEAFDPDRIRALVGPNCASGQQGNTNFNRPCVLLDDQLPNFYVNGPSFRFPAIWLSSGVEDGAVQGLSDAVPDASCNAGAGQAGINICVENGTQSDCQPDEFIIEGGQNINVPQDAMGNAGGFLNFDYDAPLTVPSSFSDAAGDGAVLISWDKLTEGDINGYRVLCADADGNPLAGKGIQEPSLTDENQGTVYFTASNLCPDGPFDDTPEGDVDNPSDEGDGGTDDGGTDDGGSGDGGTSFGAYDDPAWDLWSGAAQHGEFPTGTGTGTGTGGDTTGSGTTGDTTGGRDSTATGGSTSDDSMTLTGGASGSGSSTGSERPAEGIQSLDWRYVCTGHIADSAQNGRVDGLENGVEYQFLVVAYDIHGNPVEVSDVLTVTPRETRDLWEQCEAQGNVCGDGGYCACTTAGEDSKNGTAWLGMLVLLGLVRRRRRRTA